MSGVQEFTDTPQDDAVESHSGSIYDKYTRPPKRIDPPKIYHHGISVLEYPFPDGVTYIFYWSTAHELSYKVGNLIQGGSNKYVTQTISVHPSYSLDTIQHSVLNHQLNAPLASARTSDGNIHLFFSDNSKQDRTLTELIFDPHQSIWYFGPLADLGLKVHLNSGIGAWSEPILKVVIHASHQSGGITEAWWDTVNDKWQSFELA